MRYAPKLSPKMSAQQPETQAHTAVDSAAVATCQALARGSYPRGLHTRVQRADPPQFTV